MEKIPENNNYSSHQKSNRLLTGKQACELLGISQKTLWVWVRDGKIPIIKIGENSRARYDIRDVDALINESRTFNESYLALQKIKGEMAGGQL